ncbi:MAG: hypothetical protein J1F17_01645 [Oscillospiraceae bacterium]|nr:hypothetical protein [Oscillospiraceae bacterium]
MINGREREMARLYLEAVSIIIKLYNKMRSEDVPDSHLYLELAKDFIERNELYKDGINGLLQ